MKSEDTDALERIKQSTSGKVRYELRFFPLSVNLVKFGPVTKTWPWLYDLWSWNSI